MYTEPIIIAVTKELKAPMYIDLPTVRIADGLSRFQAIALSSFCWSSCVSSFSSGKLASIRLAIILLDLIKSKVVASLSLYSVLDKYTPHQDLRGDTILDLCFLEDCSQKTLPCILVLVGCSALSHLV